MAEESQIETLAYTRRIAEILLVDIYVELDKQDYSSNGLKDPTDTFYPKLKARIATFYLQYGTFYEDFISKISLTEINIGRQYQNGAKAILHTYNNELTPTASLALLTFFTLMAKSCITRGLDAFTDSLVEWNYRVFEEHLIEFKNNGGWEAVSKSIDTENGGRSSQKAMGYRTFIKCVLVITLGSLLIKAVVR